MAMNERVKRTVYIYLGFVVLMIVLGMFVSIITGPPDVALKKTPPPAATE